MSSQEIGPVARLLGNLLSHEEMVGEEDRRHIAERLAAHLALPPVSAVRYQKLGLLAELVLAEGQVTMERYNQAVIGTDSPSAAWLHRWKGTWDRAQADALAFAEGRLRGYPASRVRNDSESDGMWTCDEIMLRLRDCVVWLGHSDVRDLSSAGYDDWSAKIRALRRHDLTGEDRAPTFRTFTRYFGSFHEALAATHDKLGDTLR